MSEVEVMTIGRLGHRALVCAFMHLIHLFQRGFQVAPTDHVDEIVCG